MARFVRDKIFLVLVLHGSCNKWDYWYPLVNTWVILRENSLNKSGILMYIKIPKR
jgi:hypothetical protein